MIDIKQLIDHPRKTKAALAKKHYKGDIEALLKMDKEHRALISQTDNLKAEQNKLAKEIPQAEDKNPFWKNPER